MNAILQMSDITGGVTGESRDSDVVCKKLPKTSLSDQQIIERLIKSRCDLLVKNGFLGPLAMRLQFVDASNWCKTAATDGKYFYYNKDFIGALPMSQLVFLQGHEISHVIYDHVSPKRKKKRNHRAWNWANDYVINLELVRCNVGKMIDIVKPLYDEKFKNMSSEEVYEIIKDKVDDMAKKGMGTLDDHLDGQGEPTSGGGKPDLENGEKRAPDANGPAVFTDDELERIRQDTKDAAVEAYRRCETAGHVPGGLSRILRNLIRPKINWKNLLAQEIQSTLRANYTMSRPHRKGIHQGFFLPSMDREQMIDICICVDTSMSLTQEMLTHFVSEVYGIMTSYSDFKIKIWCFDTEVKEETIKTFTVNNLHELKRYKMVGGGGTHFSCNWKFMKKKFTEPPKKLIMFTDGYPGDGWGDPKYCETVFVVHGGSGEWAHGQEVPKSPWGITVPYISKGVTNDFQLAR